MNKAEDKSVRFALTESPGFYKTNYSHKGRPFYQNAEGSRILHETTLTAFGDSVAGIKARKEDITPNFGHHIKRESLPSEDARK